MLFDPPPPPPPSLSLSPSLQSTEVVTFCFQWWCMQGAFLFFFFFSFFFGGGGGYFGWHSLVKGMKSEMSGFVQSNASEHRLDLDFGFHSQSQPKGLKGVNSNPMITLWENLFSRTDRRVESALLRNANSQRTITVSLSAKIFRPPISVLHTPPTHPHKPT